MPSTMTLLAAAAGLIVGLGILALSLRGSEGAGEEGAAAGEKTGALAAAPFLFLGKFLGNITRGYVKQLGKALKINRLWKWMIKAGYRGYLQSTGADQIGHIIDQKRIRHVPLYWSDERGQWVDEPGADNPNFWNAASEGQSQYLAFNSIPCSFATGDATEMGDHLQAEVAEAFDAGNIQALFRNATVNHITVENQPPQGGAVADGGVTKQGESYLDVENPGVLDDVLVPIEGQQIISFEKYTGTYPEVVDSEEMQNQETRGRLMERDGDMHKKFMRYALILAGLFVGGLVALKLGPILLGGGGGGGGGGSLIPFMLGGGFL